MINSIRNIAADCGRQAIEEHVLALVVSTTVVSDSYTGIVDEAGIPNVFNFGSSTGELTLQSSFPAASSPVLLLGGVSVAKATGARSLALVAPDAPIVQALAGLITTAGEKIGVDVQPPIFVPADATDYAQYAAQAAGADAILAVGGDDQTEQFLRAALAAGMDLTTTPVITIASQAIVDRLGDAAEGLFITAQSWPVDDTSNADVAQYVADLAASDDNAIPSGIGMRGWIGVDELVNIIPQLPSVDPPALMAFLATSKIDRPGIPASDFSTNSFADDPLLGSLRIFQDDYLPRGWWTGSSHPPRLGLSESVTRSSWSASDGFALRPASSPCRP